MGAGVGVGVGVIVGVGVSVGVIVGVSVCVGVVVGVTVSVDVIVNVGVSIGDSVRPVLADAALHAAKKNPRIKTLKSALVFFVDICHSLQRSCRNPRTASVRIAERRVAAAAVLGDTGTPGNIILQRQVTCLYIQRKPT